MSLIVPDVGEVLLLKKALNHTAATDLKLHIFTNDIVPDEDTVIGDLTEATAAGYAAITLTGTSFTIETDGSNNTTATYAEQTFTFTEASINYGYYITDSAGTGLLWVERFSDAPHSIPSGGGTEKITLSLGVD
ncbi:MAG: hypothetical protein ACOWWR_18535 [Eubacteriales bacterium]